jgi:hypothetical protein
MTSTINRPGKIDSHSFRTSGTSPRSLAVPVVGQRQDLYLVAEQRRPAGHANGFLPAPNRPLPPSATLASSICVPKLPDCGAGGPAWWENMTPLTLGDMLRRGPWAMVDAGLLQRASLDIPPQRDMGVNESWGCGPNSSARAAILLGSSILHWGDFVDNCPRTFGLPAGIPEPWPKVGPAPESLAEYLGHCGEFQNYWPRSTGESNWSDMLCHFRYQVGVQHRPMIVLLSMTMASQHYVCLVGIDESRERAVLLNTSGILYETTLDDLRYRMEASETWGHAARQFDTYNAVRFDLASERPEMYRPPAPMPPRDPHEFLPPPQLPRPDQPGSCTPSHGPSCVIL